jgi:uncharacterized protein (TIGR02217 family)
MKFDILRSTNAYPEVQQLVGFYNARNGRYDDWLYLDPRENSVTAQSFGTGNGTTVAFELVRSYGSFIEPVGGASSVQVYKNGVLQTLTTDYTISTDTRVITFTTAPAALDALTWTGTFYYRVRFSNDKLQMEEFMERKWTSDIEFRTYRS